MERRACKKCLLQADLPEDVAAYLDRILTLLPESERAKDEVYQKRIEVCSSCSRRTEAVCQACGCYVELRAAVAEQTCPYKKWR